MIVPQKAPQTPTVARRTSTVTKQTAALVSHWYRCRTRQKSHRQERWEPRLYRLRKVRELLISQKLVSAKMVSGQGLFITLDVKFLPKEAAFEQLHCPALDILVLMAQIEKMIAKGTCSTVKVWRGNLQFQNQWSSQLADKVICRGWSRVRQYSVFKLDMCRRPVIHPHTYLLLFTHLKPQLFDQLSSFRKLRKWMTVHRR